MMVCLDVLVHQANLDRIEGEIAKLKTKYGICGFYLDYLQLVEPTKIDKANTTYAEWIAEGW